MERHPRLRCIAMLLAGSLASGLAAPRGASAAAVFWTNGVQWAASVASFDTEGFETTPEPPQLCTEWMEAFPVGNSCAHELVIHAAKLDVVFGIGWHPQDPLVDDTGLVNGSRELRGDLHSSTSLVSFGPRTNRIVFPVPVTAFGVDLAGFGTGGPHPAALEVLGQRFLVASGTDFIGITSDQPFSELTLRAEEVPNMSMWYYLDDVRFVAVPEPSSAALVALALAALAAKRGRLAARGRAQQRTAS